MLVGRVFLPTLAALLLLATAMAPASAFLPPPVTAASEATVASTAVNTADVTIGKAAQRYDPPVRKYVTYVWNLQNVQAALNKCNGAVVWNSQGEGAPWLMFEHDYCGGAWVLSVQEGDLVRIRNGNVSGVWRANGKVRIVSRGALVSTTAGLGQLVAQTCIPGTLKMRLVGFEPAR